jgi:hypothetical protein
MSRAMAATLILGVVALAFGCATPAENRRDGLVKIAREYNDGLRWRRYQDVTPHLAAEEAQAFLTRAGALGDDFQMADQEVSSIRFENDGLRAAVTVQFTWYSQRRALVRNTVIAQDWRYADGRWLCAVQRRVSGDRFPLVPEPLTGAVSAAPPAPPPSP